MINAILHVLLRLFKWLYAVNSLIAAISEGNRRKKIFISFSSKYLKLHWLQLTAKLSIYHIYKCFRNKIKRRSHSLCGDISFNLKLNSLKRKDQHSESQLHLQDDYPDVHHGRELPNLFQKKSLATHFYCQILPDSHSQDFFLG